MTEKNREIVGVDQDGNTWKIRLEVVAGYTNKFKSYLFFNDQRFYLEKFISAKDANHFWNLIEALRKKVKDKEKA